MLATVSQETAASIPTVGILLYNENRVSGSVRNFVIFRENNIFDSYEKFTFSCWLMLNSLNAKLNSTYHLLALLGAHPILYVSRVSVNRLTPNDPYMGRTAPQTSKRYILYIYSTNIGTEYFKHALYSPFFSLQNAVCFIMVTNFMYRVCWNLKKKNNSGAKVLKRIPYEESKPQIKATGNLQTSTKIINNN